MKHTGVDALVIGSPELIRYLTGFTGSESLFVLGKTEGCLFVDSRYTEQARRECGKVQTVECAKKTDGALRYLTASGKKNVGFDPRKLTVAEKKIFDSSGLFQLIEMPDMMEGVRAKKDAGEIARIRSAARIASSAFLEVLDGVKVGSREEEVALQLEFAIRQKGAEAVSFPIIVASGARGALPHGLASTKKIEKGDFVTIDYGAVYRGYYSDETCTVVFGRPGSRQKKVYQVVRDAHDRAISAIKQGVSTGRIDAAARGVVEKAGLGRYFRHGTGHGVGLAVHEEPRIAPGQDTILEEDMVFTVEPGVYIPGWGGVRIEDLVRVTSDGCELLSSVDKELRCL
jgi:Xaa-Pro aminopeptidase